MLSQPNLSVIRMPLLKTMFQHRFGIYMYYGVILNIVNSVFAVCYVGILRPFLNCGFGVSLLMEYTCP